MNLSEHHPSYSDAWVDWALMRHAYAGERIVKQQGTLYLSPTGGMLADGMKDGQPGLAAYSAYLQRGVYHEFVSTAVQAMIGLMHRKEPVIQLPKRLEAMEASATIFGEPLKTLLRRINQEQLIAGRIGLLLDLPPNPGADAVPYIATYTAESIINWDTRIALDGRRTFDFVALNETGPFRQAGQLTWRTYPRFRILASAEFLASVGADLSALTALPADYVAGSTFNATDLHSATLISPEIAGRRLQRIPFVIAGAMDLDPMPDLPPLLALARKAMSLYRLEADYRHQLFMQSQDTFVVTGYTRAEGEAAPRVGAGAVLFLDQGASAQYVGVNSNGLPEMRQAVNAEKLEAAELGAQIIDANSTKSSASGEALSIRVAARTATLLSIARAGGDALERTLKTAAEWVGANPNEVVIRPNTDFGDEAFTADMLLKLMQAKGMGAPISNRTIHQIMTASEMTELSYQDEVEEIAYEADPAGKPLPVFGSSPDDTGKGVEKSGITIPTNLDDKATADAPGSSVTPITVQVITNR